MINLTTLVIEYKEKKQKKILDQIYKELKDIIKQKARFIFYAKWYPLNLYHPCKYCRNCNKLNNIPKEEHNTICKDCDVCKCVKGFFNLKKDALCDYEDVENDLWLEILRILENFDTTKDFNTYLFSSLWEWIPSFITKDFVKSLSNTSLTQKNEEGNEAQMDIIDEQGQNSDTKLSSEDILKVCKNKKEKQLINLFLKDETMTQEKAGEVLNISQQAISLIFKNLKKRLLKQLKNENQNL